MPSYGWLSVTDLPPRDTSILACPNVRLNETCINDCAAFLYSTFLPSTSPCAILSTHDLLRIRFHADADVDLAQRVVNTNLGEVRVDPSNTSSTACGTLDPLHHLSLFSMALFV